MSLAELFDTLDRLEEVHHMMLSCGEEKQKAIIDNNVNELIRLNSQEARYLKEVLRLEEVREENCQQYLREKGIKSALRLNLTELSRLVFDPVEKEKLLARQTKLSHVLHELKKVNDRNQSLVQQSLQFLDYSLNLLNGIPDYDVTYHRPDTDHKQGTRSLMRKFDTRA